MKKYREIFFYLVTLLAFTGVIYLVIDKGTDDLETPALRVPEAAATEHELLSPYLQNLRHPLAILLLQIITIILAARFFGYICKKIKQPTVIGEIAAGIILGPSVLTSLAPEWSAFLFPPQSLGNLQFLSQIGLILFMFVVGMELDIKVLKNRARDALIISHASIIVPFTLGVFLAYLMYDSFAPDTISFLAFALFIGIAMSITAFPVLARIVQERGLSKTRLGMVAITCAAADDITAWCLLAAVIAIVKAGSAMSAIGIIVLACLYVIMMLKLIRPILKNIGEKYANREALSKPVVAIFFITLLFSSCITEVIGIHALFGAFMAGVIMPTNVRFRNLFTEKVEDISLVLLLPLFFVFTGLRTEIGLLDSAHLWKICLLIVAVAVAGKFLGSAVAAKLMGQSWHDSLTIGALMNTRGLMELVVLNIGYDLGVLTPQVFAMMVIMALLTTVMTAPALYFIERYLGPKDYMKQLGTVSYDNKYNILISFGSPDKGVALLRVAHALTKESRSESTITAMHLSPSNEINQYNFIEFEKESFRPIKIEARKMHRTVNLFFKPSQDIEGEITDTANQGNFNLLLIGIGHSVLEGTLIGKIMDVSGRVMNPARLFRAMRGTEKLFAKTQFDEKVTYIVRSAQVPVGVLVAQRLDKVEKVIFPLISGTESDILDLARRLITNQNVQLTVAAIAGDYQAPQQITDFIEEHPRNVQLVQGARLDKRFLQDFDLMLLDMNGWKEVVAGRHRWPGNTLSVLILRP